MQFNHDILTVWHVFSYHISLLTFNDTLVDVTTFSCTEYHQSTVENIFLDTENVLFSGYIIVKDTC